MSERKTVSVAEQRATEVHYQWAVTSEFEDCKCGSSETVQTRGVSCVAIEHAVRERQGQRESEADALKKTSLTLVDDASCEAHVSDGGSAAGKMILAAIGRPDTEKICTRADALAVCLSDMPAVAVTLLPWALHILGIVLFVAISLLITIYRSKASEVISQSMALGQMRSQCAELDRQRVAAQAAADATAEKLTAAQEVYTALEALHSVHVTEAHERERKAQEREREAQEREKEARAAVQMQALELAKLEQRCAQFDRSQGVVEPAHNRTQVKVSRLVLRLQKKQINSMFYFWADWSTHQRSLSRRCTNMLNRQSWNAAKVSFYCWSEAFRDGKHRRLLGAKAAERAELEATLERNAAAASQVAQQIYAAVETERGANTEKITQLQHQLELTQTTLQETERRSRAQEAQLDKAAADAAEELGRHCQSEIAAERTLRCQLEQQLEQVEAAASAAASNAESVRLTEVGEATERIESMRSKEAELQVLLRSSREEFVALEEKLRVAAEHSAAVVMAEQHSHELWRAQLAEAVSAAVVDAQAEAEARSELVVAEAMLEAEEAKEAAVAAAVTEANQAHERTSLALQVARQEVAEAAEEKQLRTPRASAAARLAAREQELLSEAVAAKEAAVRDAEVTAEAALARMASEMAEKQTVHARELALLQQALEEEKAGLTPRETTQAKLADASARESELLEQLEDLQEEMSFVQSAGSEIEEKLAVTESKMRELERELSAAQAEMAAAQAKTKEVEREAANAVAAAKAWGLERSYSTQ